MERLTREAELVERLKAHPPLLARVESILSAVENETGALQEAGAPLTAPPVLPRVSVSPFPFSSGCDTGQDYSTSA